MIRMIAVLVLASQLLGSTAWAYDLGIPKEITVPPANTSEYIYRNDTDEALIPVYLLGAVSKPGLYHIPRNTELIALLTLAGGANSGAQIDRILVKGQGAASASADREIRFDLERAVQGKGATSIGLESNDLVYVTPGKPPLSADVLTYLGIATGIMGIIASSILVSQALNK